MFRPNWPSSGAQGLQCGSYKATATVTILFVLLLCYSHAHIHFYVFVDGILFCSGVKAFDLFVCCIRYNPLGGRPPCLILVDVEEGI
jgi:hypothetical protein